MEGLTLILLAILIWLLYRWCTKPHQKRYRKYSDKPREDYILKDTRREKHKVNKKGREAIIKEGGKNTPKFEVGDNEVKCNFKGKTFLLDKKGYEFFYREFVINGGLSIKNDYLAIDNPANKYILFFHRRFMRIEIEDFCSENNCEGKDVVVHHRDFTTTNNKKENLKVMFEHEHKKLHHREI